MVLWVFLQTISSFLFASSDALAKKLLQNQNVRFVALAKFVISVIVISIVALIFGKVSIGFIPLAVLAIAGFL